MDLLATSISVKQTHMHVNSAYVNMFVMRLCVCATGFMLISKVSMNVSCFPQYAGCWGSVKSQIIHWLIVILCASLCGAVHLLQQRKVGINSMSNLKCR